VTDFQSKVYGVWQVDSSSYFYEPYFSRSLDNGGNWESPQVVGSKTKDIGEVPAIARTASGKIAVLWEDQYRTSDDKRDIFARISEDDGAHWSGVKNVSPSAGFSRNVSATASDSGFQAAWHDERRGSYQIYISTYAVGITLPAATPLLDSGQTITRNSVVGVSFTNITGSPDSLRYRWDAPPTDADAWVPFANPLTIQGPSGVTAEACRNHTLYTQVRRGTTLGTATQDSEIFDIGIQAGVTIVNRHLAGIPAAFRLGSEDVYTGPGGNGASDGDPNYTRERSFFLGINGYNDCSGLTTYSIPGSASGAISNSRLTSAPVLPGANTPGAHPISVTLLDTLGNTRTDQRTLIYDPANTDTTGTQTNTLGLPVLASGGSVTADNDNSVLRTLSFQGINVTDNLYGQQANLPQLADGKQFWGVWLANSTSSTATADDPNLHWYPVRVPNPDSSFTVEWNLFSGLGYTADLRNKPGTYYVFVRFLDGAGNPSTRSLKVTATLTDGYAIPTQRFPKIVE
jgi:hypothetical protein